MKFENVTETRAEQMRNMVRAVAKNPKGVKYATIPAEFDNERDAQELYDALVFVLGGAEMNKKGNKFVVTSMGYYYYMGA